MDLKKKNDQKISWTARHVNENLWKTLEHSKWTRTPIWRNPEERD